MKGVHSSHSKPGVQLPELMDHWTGTEPGRPLVQTELGSKFSSINSIQEDYYREAYLASVFWQVYKETPTFNYLLLRRGNYYKDKNKKITPITLVVPHGNDTTSPRFDLVVMDKEYSGEPMMIPVDLVDKDIYEPAYLRWLKREFPDPRMSRFNAQLFDLFHAAGSGFLAEFTKNKDFKVLLIPAPKMVLTAAPTPSWGVHLHPNDTYLGTAGTYVMDQEKRRFGVTVSMHALNINNPGDRVDNLPVFINGKFGMLRKFDTITDSAFVETIRNPFERRPPERGCRGPLCGVTPRLNEEVFFEGVTSGLTRGIVNGFSEMLVSNFPGTQKIFTTTAMTGPGDSGAALTNKDDYILGFAHSRTGAGSLIDFSSWVWADSVYQALRIAG